MYLPRSRYLQELGLDLRSGALEICNGCCHASEVLPLWHCLLVRHLSVQLRSEVRVHAELAAIISQLMRSMLGSFGQVSVRLLSHLAALLCVPVHPELNGFRVQRLLLAEPAEQPIAFLKSQAISQKSCRTTSNLSETL